MEPQKLIGALEMLYDEFTKALLSFDVSANPEILSKTQCIKMLHLMTEVQDEILFFYLKKIVTMENPYLPKLRMNKIKERVEKSKLSFDQLLQQFHQQQDELLNLLCSLPEKTWAKTGLHETEGHITIIEIVDKLIKKNREFLFQFSTACENRQANSQKK